MTDGCYVVGDEIEPGMWRLKCACGWTSLVPEDGKLGATLSHLVSVGVEPENDAPTTVERRRREVAPVVAKAVLMTAATIGLALWIWVLWVF